MGQEPAILTLACLSAVHEKISFIPNFDMTGKRIAQLLDIMVGSFQDSDRITAPESVQNLQSRLGRWFNEVRAQLKKYGERRRKYYNLSTHGTEYKPGDLV